MEIYQFSIFELEPSQPGINEITIIENGELKKKPINDLVIEKMDLVKNVLYKLNIPSRLINDYIDIGYIALIESLKKYDYTKNQNLNQYLWVSISNAIKNEFTQQKRDVHFNSISYDVCIDGNENTIGELIVDPTDFDDYLTKEERRDIILNLLNQKYLYRKKDKDIYCKFYGIRCPSYSAEELSKIYNMSTNSITKLVSKITKDLENLTSKYHTNDY